MKQFRVYSIDKWIEQNDGEIIDFAEGTLIDNYVIGCESGIAFAFERPATCWTSYYHVHFFQSENVGTDAYKQVENSFYKLLDEAEQPD